MRHVRINNRLSLMFCLDRG